MAEAPKESSGLSTHRHRLRENKRVSSPQVPFGKLTLRTGWLPYLSTLALVFLFALPVGAEAAGRYVVSVGGGTSVPMQSELRDVFDKAKAASISFASRVPNRRASVFLEVGWEKADGNPFTPDATFEIDETTLTRVPLSTGLRVDLVPAESRTSLMTQLGYGVHWVFLNWDPPLGESETKSTFGGFVELRSSYAISKSVGAWVRPRVSLLFEADFDAQPDIDASTLIVDLGVSYAFGSPREARTTR